MHASSSFNTCKRSLRRYFKQAVNRAAASEGLSIPEVSIARCVQRASGERQQCLQCSDKQCAFSLSPRYSGRAPFQTFLERFVCFKLLSALQKMKVVALIR